MKELVEQLAQEFSDYDYAHGYLEGHVVSRLASQIFVLRKQRGWSQSELAARAGMSQEQVSKYENEDFDSITTRILTKFSRAFDVSLHVSFQEVSDAILDVVNITADRLKVQGRGSSLKALRSHLVATDAKGKWCAYDVRLLTLTETPISVSEPARVSTSEWQAIRTIDHAFPKTGRQSPQSFEAAQ